MDTTTSPNITGDEPRAPAPPPARPSPPPPSPPPSNPNKSSPSGFSIAAFDFRSPEEELELRECEEVVGQGLANFVRVGEALIRIRDKKLYKNEFASFEDYCRERWGFGRSQTWRYLSAAEVHRTLATVPGIPMPECEAQIRPLTGLPAELAQQAWLSALGWSRTGYVPARLVERAVRQVLKTEQEPVSPAETKARKQARFRRRESIRAGFQHLLSLVLASAERDVVVAQVQEIQRLLEPLLNPQKKQG